MNINGRELKKQAVQRPFMSKPFQGQMQNAQRTLQQNARALDKFSAPKQSFLELKGRIIEFIRQRGPVIPIQVAKAFGKDTMFAGAMLSELIANRVLKVSNAKIGSSPVYYMPGQEEKLEILRGHLSQTPRQAYDLLKERRIISDTECEAWQRVALRELKDFAMPIAVRHDDGSEEVFWRWHMVPEEEARKRITAIVEGKLCKRMGDTTPKPEQIEPVPPKKHDAEKLGEEQKTLEPKEEKKKAEKPKKPKKEKIDAFRSELLSTIRGKGLSVLEEVPMKKNDYGFVVRVSSAIGELNYLAIAKKKKKLSDDDITVAYSIGLQHKLPVILIGNELSSKAEKMLSTGMKGVVFIKH